MNTLQFHVPDMACAACAETITQALKAIDATVVVEPNLQTKQVTIQTQCSQDRAIATIQAAGYTVA